VIKKPRKTRRLKPATGLWKIQPHWVVRPGKQTNKQQAVIENTKGMPRLKIKIKYGDHFERFVKITQNKKVYL
jgi:hypothetical protein